MDGVRILVNTDFRCENLKAVFHKTVSFADGGVQHGDNFANHRQVQDNRAIATVNRLQIQLVVTCRTDIESVLIINLALANLRRNFRRDRLIQRKNQDSRVSTSVGIGAVTIVTAGLGESGVGQRPVVLVAASVHGGFRVSAVVNGEVQRHHTITTVGSSKGLRIVASLGVYQIIPKIAAAGGGFDKLSHRVVDGQVECYYRIATGRIRERVRVVAA